MKEPIMAFTIVVIMGVIAFFLHNYEYDNMCLDSEMQYYQAKCQWYQTKPDHKVCKAGEIIIYFNMSKDENLTETQVKELAERL